MELSREIYDRYIKYCEKGKKLSKHTIKAYRIDIRQFYEYTNNKKEKLNKAFLDEYLYYLNDLFKPRTVIRKCASLHSFFKYLVAQGVMEATILVTWNVNVKKEKTLPKVIEKENLYKLFESIYHLESKTKIRDTVIIELLLSTGIRVSELCSLKRKDVNIYERYIIVHGKGNKERIIYLGSDQVMQIVKEYKLMNHTTCNDDSPFIMNKKGEGISDQSIRNIIKKYTKYCGIYSNITPHMFRHTFATMLLEEDVDIRYIQSILGHSSITTTQIYTHTCTNKQREIMKMKNPRNFIGL